MNKDTCNKYAESIATSNIQLSDASNCCNAIRDHLVKMDELMESRLVLEELLNKLTKAEDGNSRIKNA